MSSYVVVAYVITLFRLCLTSHVQICLDFARRGLIFIAPHTHALLVCSVDADQDIPWTDRPLTYRLKFRFWYQDYNASYHRNVKRTTWGIASPVEYDVPKCAANVEGCALVNGTWIHTITGTFQGNGKLVAAHFHCHAPTCLSVSLYRNDTGELLCREVPVYGLNEPGFISQPPCLWGSETPESFGLETPPDVNGVALHAIKTSNATHGHHGEMAWLQMFHV